MGTYNVSQVGSLDTWAALEGVAPGKAFVEADLAAEFTGLSINNTPPGGASPFWHTHATIEEIYVFIEGTGELALDDDVVPVAAGTIVRVGQDVWRALHCLTDSATDLKWLCIRAGGAPLAVIGNDAEIDRERPYPWA